MLVRSLRNGRVVSITNAAAAMPDGGTGRSSRWHVASGSSRTVTVRQVTSRVQNRVWKYGLVGTSGTQNLESRHGGPEPDPNMKWMAHGREPPTFPVTRKPLDKYVCSDREISEGSRGSPLKVGLLPLASASVSCLYPLPVPNGSIR